MKTKKEKIAEATKMLEALGLRAEDLLKNIDNTLKMAPKFLDIQEINDVPYLYLRHNKNINKHEWLCLEVPDEVKMPREKGQDWCKSKGGEYGEISTLKFISERVDNINVILEANDYPLIVKDLHWSIEYYHYYSWLVNMRNGSHSNNTHTTNHVRAVLTK